MANSVLFISSCMILATHCIAFYCFNAPIILQYTYILGSYTSLWNHGTSCVVARWSDRLVMLGGLVVDIWFIFCQHKSSSGIALLCIFTALSIVCYGCAKCLGQPMANVFHVYSHMFVCMSHFTMLLFLCSNNEKSIS